MVISLLLNKIVVLKVDCAKILYGSKISFRFLVLNIIQKAPCPKTDGTDFTGFKTNISILFFRKLINVNVKMLNVTKHDRLSVDIIICRWETFFTLLFTLVKWKGKMPRTIFILNCQNSTYSGNEKNTQENLK